MKLIFFTKMLQEHSIDRLIDFALEYGFEGFDLTVRPGYAVAPDNVRETMPVMAGKAAEAGLTIPMVTGAGDLLFPEDPTAEPILAAMSEAGIPLLKLGYFPFDPAGMDYRQEADRIRRAFEGWESLAGRYGVKICTHTHSKGWMGCNASATMRLIEGFDPQHIGAYLDPAHLLLEGETFGTALSIAREYLCAVALKDVLVEREAKEDHGALRTTWVSAGEGAVDWTDVFSNLARVGYDGPLTVHYQHKMPEGRYEELVRNEADFFRRHAKKASGSGI